MKTVVNLFLLLMAVTFASPVMAENMNDGENSRHFMYSIKGVVMDENKSPLPGAAIRVVGTTVGAGTNSQGEYIISFNDDDERRVRISYLGYEPQIITVKPSRTPNTMHIMLVPATNQLQDVVVTGSFVEKPLKDVPVMTRVITSKDIQALNPQSFESLLQYELPGLQIGYNSMSGLPEITYQGMEGEYVLFLIDGERVSGEGADHNVDFTRFNVDEIERIEVIDGAQSTIYGSNALGGVINVITKNADRPINANINARYAGTNGQKYTGNLGIKRGNLSSYTSLTYRVRDSYQIRDESGLATETIRADGTHTISSTMPDTLNIYGYHIWDFSQRFGYTFNEKLSAEVKGTLYHNKNDIRSGQNYQNIFYDYSLRGKVVYLPAEHQQITVSYIFDDYFKDKRFLTYGNERTDYHNRTQTPRIDYTGTFGAHTISAGFEGNFEYLKHYMMADSSSVSVNTYSVYLQEDWKINDELNIVAGVRGDYHEKYRLHVTPKISAMWRFCENLTLRAGYAQGFRSPSLKELYQEYDMGGMGWFILYGNPDLEPETSNQYTLSMEATRGPLYWTLGVSHNRFKNRISYTYVGDGSTDMIYINSDNSKTTSVSAILRYRFNFGLLLTGSYVYVDDYLTVDGYNTSLTRPHSITFSAMYTRKFGKIGTNIALNGQWASHLDTYERSTDSSGNYTYERVEYESRTMCSLNAGVVLPRGVSINFGIDNLFNYIDKAGSSGLQLPQKGISFVGTVNLNLADMFKW